MTQDEAHRARAQFIARAHAAGRRCVLVITGKGTGDRGGVPVEPLLTTKWYCHAGILAQPAIEAFATASPSGRASMAQTPSASCTAASIPRRSPGV